MIDKLKDLLKHSFVYSLSNVAIKASGIILLPLQTGYLSESEYGRYGLVYATIMLLSQGLVLGQGNSIVRFNNEITFKERKRSIFFTIMVFMLIVTVLFFVFAKLSLSTSISIYFNDPTEALLYHPLFDLSIYIICFSILNNLFLNKLRAEEKSVFYSLLGIIKITVIVLGNLYTLILLNMKVEGILYSLLAGELVTLLLIFPSMIKQLDLKIEKGIVKESLRFGIPLLFSVISMQLLMFSDRYVLQFFSGDVAVGKYEVAYRVAGILNMFVYVPFSITLLPAAYKVYKQEGDKRFYGKLMTYITIILCWAGLGLSVLSKEVVIIFAQNESYHSVHFIVPLLIFSYVIIGMISVASLGMYLTNNTKWIAIITLLCACINILLNIFFIPQFGLVAAAINTVVAFIILLLLSIKFSNKYYRVNYDSLAVLKIIFLTIILYFAITLIDTESLLIDFASKFILALIFPSFLLLLKIFDANEKKFIKKIIYLINKPKELITFIKSESPNLN